MKIKMVIFLTSLKEHNRAEMVMKTFESTIRPVIGDIIDDPGFDAKFHNGYEVVKVSINYEANECYVSLSPLALELEEISFITYLDKLLAHGWHIVSKEDLSNG